VSWDLKFSEPIELPASKKFKTLRDAANYIFTLPKSEYDSEEWRTALQGGRPWWAGAVCAHRRNASA
jgi:hypothetical protein